MKLNFQSLTYRSSAMVHRTDPPPILSIVGIGAWWMAATCSRIRERCSEVKPWYACDDMTITGSPLSFNNSIALPHIWPIWANVISMTSLPPLSRESMTCSQRFLNVFKKKTIMLGANTCPHPSARTFLRISWSGMLSEQRMATLDPIVIITLVWYTGFPFSSQHGKPTNSKFIFSHHPCKISRNLFNCDCMKWAESRGKINHTSTWAKSKSERSDSATYATLWIWSSTRLPVPSSIRGGVCFSLSVKSSIVLYPMPQI